MHTCKNQLWPLAVAALFLFTAAATVSAQTPNIPLQTVDEEVRVDDGVAEGSPVSAAELIIVNRITPARYPATLKAIRIYFKRVNPTPVGAQIRLLAFARDTSVADATVSRPSSYLVNQTVTVPNVSTTGEFAEFTVTNPPTINSGDFFVGFQQLTASGAFFWFDASEPFPVRSYVAVPPDGSFTNEFVTGGLPITQPAVNFMARAVLSLPVAAAPIVAVSAASYLVGDFTAESIIAIYGTNLSSGTLAASTTPLPTTLSGTSVKVKDSANVERAAGLFFVSSGQINCLVPQGTRGGAATLTVTNGNGQTFSTTVNITGVAAGLFTTNATGIGVPAAVLLRVKADGSLVYDPVARFDAGSNQWVPLPLVFGPDSEQDFLILYGTGWRGRSSLSNARVNIAQFENGSPGTSLDVLFAGAQGDQVGLDQMNVRLPRTLAGKGEMHLRTTIDGRTANLVKVSFQ